MERATGTRERGKLMYLATLDTRHFSFVALDTTEEETLAQMQQAWIIHQEQTGATYEWEEIKEDVSLTFIRQGDVLRNYTLIHSYDKPRKQQRGN